MPSLLSASPQSQPKYLSFCQAALTGGTPEQYAGTFSRLSLFCLSFPTSSYAQQSMNRHLRTRQHSPAVPEVEEACRNERPARRQGRVQAKALSQAPLFSSPMGRSQSSLKPPTHQGFGPRGPQKIQTKGQLEACVRGRELVGLREPLGDRNGDAYSQ